MHYAKDAQLKNNLAPWQRLASVFTLEAFSFLNTSSWQTKWPAMDMAVAMAWSHLRFPWPHGPHGPMAWQVKTSTLPNQPSAQLTKQCCPVTSGRGTTTATKTAGAPVWFSDKSQGPSGEIFHSRRSHTGKLQLVMGVPLKMVGLCWGKHTI